MPHYKADPKPWRTDQMPTVIVGEGPEAIPYVPKWQAAATEVDLEKKLLAQEQTITHLRQIVSFCKSVNNDPWLKEALVRMEKAAAND